MDRRALGIEVDPSAGGEIRFDHLDRIEHHVLVGDRDQVGERRAVVGDPAQMDLEGRFWGKQLGGGVTWSSSRR